jgi:hypothetical protein
MFNAVLVPNPNLPNSVEIIPMVDYLGSGAEYDWTGKLDLSKYKSPPYDYRKRLFRNYLRNDEYHSHCASDYDYPGIFKSNIEKIKMNPDLFGEYSRKIAKNL